MSDIAISLQNVHKYYGKVHALRGVNLEVKQGEVFGFLGPNGAGKTTSIRCMLDLIRPNSGEIAVLGINPQRFPIDVKEKVGYLPGDLKLDGDFSPREFFKYIRTLRKKCRPWKDILELADRLDLDLDKKIKALSQGNKQKVGLIQSLISQVPLLLLDEPTLGLDPLMKQEILNIIREQRMAGTTVFFSSHILSEVQKVADRVGIIRKGALVEIADTEDLLRRSLTRATIQFGGAVSRSKLENIPNVDILRVNNNDHSYTLEVKGEMNGLIKALVDYTVLDLEISKPSLEEVFMKYYEKRESED
jgi:ABC-2 type transport system ATP-binding protein